MQESDTNAEPLGELNVSFGYQCSVTQTTTSNMSCDFELSANETHIQKPGFLTKSGSFCCLSGAALSANYTLANTNIGNGIIGEGILPGLDSPKSFRSITSCSRVDWISSSSPSEVLSSPLSPSISTDGELLEGGGRHPWKSNSAPSNLESSGFLHAMDIKMAGGAAGEDRVQAVCSKENGWLYCGVYDGFNGRDAADFLAATLYENITLNLQEWNVATNVMDDTTHNDDSVKPSSSSRSMEIQPNTLTKSLEGFPSESFDVGVMRCLTEALSRAESEFMFVVEQEMEQRPDLVSVGSSVLAMLLYGRDLYVMNLGDSRAVLASQSASLVTSAGSLQAIQLTEIHTVDNESEHMKVLADHPDDPSPITAGRVKGKLKLTRAFGVGYLKKKEMNDALMGILQVRNLCHPPYVYTDPFTIIHKVSDDDLFVILGSDGLFDFFSNFEVVRLVHQFIRDKPCGDPAKYLIEQLVHRAAENACFTREELMKVPLGRRRKYHDDVTVIVIILGNNKRASTASAHL